jgi:hypothetical protein
MQITRSAFKYHNANGYGDWCMIRFSPLPVFCNFSIGSESTEERNHAIEQSTDIRDLFMKFKETPYDGDSSPSDIWPETMDSISFYNDVTASHLIPATKEKRIALGDLKMGNSDHVFG